MENNDKLVNDGLILIDNQIEFYENKLNELVNSSNLKTNCKFRYSEKEDFINLRTVVDVSDYARILGFIKSLKEQYFEAVKELLSYEHFGNFSEFEYLGYSYSNWMNDIVYLYKKKLYSDALVELRNKKEKLSSFYSKETKDFIEINNILKGI